MSNYNPWKKRVLAVCLLFAIGWAILLAGAAPEKALTAVAAFLFIFVANVTLFPPVIRKAVPQRSRWVRNFSRRGPPIF